MNKEEISRAFSRVETKSLYINLLKTEEDVQSFMVEFCNLSEEIEFKTKYLEELYKININDFKSYLSNREFLHDLFLNSKILVFEIHLQSTDNLIAACFCEFLSDENVYIEGFILKESPKQYYPKEDYLHEALLKIIQTLDFYGVQQFLSIANANITNDSDFNKKLGFVQLDINDIYYSLATMSFHDTFKKIANDEFIVYALPKINPLAFKYCDEAKEEDHDEIKEELYTKALLIEPYFILAKDSLAWTKLKLGNLEEAIKIFTEILKLKPNKYSSFLGRAYAYSDIGNYTKAIYDFLEYLGFGFDDDDTYVLLGDAYCKQKEYAKALSSYEFAYKLNPNNMVAKLNIVSVQQILN